MLDDFAVTMTLPILWGDQDAFGHVNNTACIRWFECARVRYLERLGLGELHGPQHLGPILAKVTCNYRRQLNYPDEVTIGARIVSIGNSSYVMEHAVWSQSQHAFAADGESVVVMFDYQTQRPVRVPDEIRAAIAQLEGRDFSA